MSGGHGPSGLAGAVSMTCLVGLPGCDDLGCVCACHGEPTWACGAFQPTTPPLEPYRCSAPADHDGDHRAFIDGAVVARWPRKQP